MENNKYCGIRTSCVSLIPKIIEVEFTLKYNEKNKETWLYISKGGVTGFESAQLPDLIMKYPEKNVFCVWIANMGTLHKYDRLEIPIYEIIKYLIHNKKIVITKEYGYIKNIRWL
jgi:hypothetical protein